MKTLFLVLAACLSAVLILNADSLRADDGDLEGLRKVYYAALEEEDEIDPAIKQFESVSVSKVFFAPTAKVYIGSLTAVKAKFAFWPGTKLDYANQGIAIMEEGLAKAKDNIEALFIYGTTCYYLPFFFNMGDEAEAALKKIIAVMNKSSMDQFPTELLTNALKFIEENIDLEKDEIERVKELKEMLNV